MRKRVGVALGCALAALAAAKAVELQRLDHKKRHDRFSPGSDDTAARVRALGDLARERLTTFLDGPAGEAARDRMSELLGASLAGVGADRRWGQSPST